jgi:hypothetical protein
LGSNLLWLEVEAQEQNKKEAKAKPAKRLRVGVVIDKSGGYYF